MPDSPRITLRLPDKLLSAARKAAQRKGHELGAYIRSLVEADTGVSGTLPANGFESLTDKQRSEMGRKAAEIRHGKNSE